MEEIERSLSGRTLSALIGGPPCQGFSTAGRRIPSDSRNSLVKKMLDLANKLQPETIVVENVPGMKWMKNGQVIESLVASLDGCGYASTIFDLKAEEFCVPQRRRRLFVVASRNNEELVSPEGIFSSIVRGKTRKDVRPANDELPLPVNVLESISDLPTLSTGQGEDRVEYNPKWTKTDYQRLMRGQIDLPEFISKRAEEG
jgi:DNA (cytosine-5)-methyltransferase 1